jgi:hypothetical protein
MWIKVQQIVPDGVQENYINVELVERAHNTGNGNPGLTLHLQSGQMINIREDFDSWMNLIKEG